jgi:Zn-dependent protease
VFRAFGIEVRVRWWTVLAPALFYVVFTQVGRFLVLVPDSSEAALWAAGWTVALLLTVWCHEMAHAWVARRFGVATRQIVLSPLGGLMHAHPEAQDSRAAISIAMAGPLFHAAVAGILVALRQGFAIASSELSVWTEMYTLFIGLQVVLAAFNLLPFHPLDAGRVLHALLLRRTSRTAAATYVGYIGCAGGIVIAMIGVAAFLQAKGPDVVGAVAYAPILVWIGVSNYLTSRRLQRESRPPAQVHQPVEAWRRGAATSSEEPWKESLVESERLARAEDRRERRVAEARRLEEVQRGRLQDRIDQLLDRINELGGVEKLSPAERRELAEASELLHRVPAES